MATLLGSLLVSLGMESAQFKRGANDAQKRMAQLGNTMRGIGASLSVAVTAPLVLFGKSALTAGTEAREAFAQVEQALTTMGGASGKTADQLKQSAQELATFSNFNRTDILGKVTANLLTFGNVSGEVFDRAQQAAVDLSARLGQDLQSSAIQLGKALNDPLKGITALSRVGVSFTEEQKAMIKAMTEAGDVAGAQGLILSELEKQYGGAAKAARDAAPGGDQIQAWRELQEAVGERLVVAFGELEKIIAPIIRSFLSLDEKTQTIVVVFGAIAAAAGPLLVVLGGFVSLAPAIAAGFAAMSAAALPVAAVVAAVAAAGYLIYQNWDKIGPVLDDVAEGFQNAIGPDLKRIIDEVSAKLSELWTYLESTFGPPLRELIGAAGELISSLWNGPLGTGMRGVLVEIVAFSQKWSEVMGPALLTVLKAAAVVIGATFEQIANVIRFVAAVLRGDWSGAWQAAKDIVGAVVNPIVGFVQSMFTGIKTWLVDKLDGLLARVRNFTTTVSGFFKDMYIAVVGNSWVPDMVDGIANEMARLDTVMVAPARKATNDVKQAMRDMAAETQALFARLFPEAERLKAYREDMAAIDRLDIPDDQKTEARRRAGQIFRGETPGSRPDTEIKALELKSAMKVVVKETKDMEKEAEIATVRIADSFADMAQKSISALQGLVGAIKGGGFLDILGAAVGLFTQLAGAGVFGEGMRDKMNSVPKFANGTRSFSGGLAVVGERGPELVNLPRRSQVIPNHKLNGVGGSIAQIVPSPYFDVVVDGRVMRQAPAVANAGAMQAQAMGARSARRSVRR